MIAGNTDKSFHCAPGTRSVVHGLTQLLLWQPQKLLLLHHHPILHRRKLRHTGAWVLLKALQLVNTAAEAAAVGLFGVQAPLSERIQAPAQLWAHRRTWCILTVILFQILTFSRLLLSPSIKDVFFWVLKALGNLFWVIPTWGKRKPLCRSSVKGDWTLSLVTGWLCGWSRATLLIFTQPRFSRPRGQLVPHWAAVNTK